MSRTPLAASARDHRNALLMAGIDSNWQGAFVGAFIILAVLIGMETRGFSLTELLRNLFRPGKDR